jgi:hypothetical protein
VVGFYSKLACVVFSTFPVSLAAGRPREYDAPRESCRLIAKAHAAFAVDLCITEAAAIASFLPEAKLVVFAARALAACLVTAGSNDGR